MNLLLEEILWVTHTGFRQPLRRHSALQRGAWLDGDSLMCLWLGAGSGKIPLTPRISVTARGSALDTSRAGS